MNYNYKLFLTFMTITLCVFWTSEKGSSGQNKPITVKAKPLPDNVTELERARSEKLTEVLQLAVDRNRDTLSRAIKSGKTAKPIIKYVEVIKTIPYAVHDTIYMPLPIQVREGIIKEMQAVRAAPCRPETVYITKKTFLQKLFINKKNK